MANGRTDVIFQEIQYPRQWWLVVLLAVPFTFAWYAFIAQVLLGKPVGDNPMSNWGAWLVWLFFGLFLPLFFFAVRLETEVDGGRLTVRFFPHITKTLSPHDIDDYYVRTYRPLKEYGGWGVRWSPRFGWAYNASGNQGVQLELAVEKQLLIGSQRPEELLAALDQMTGRKRKR